MPSVHAETSTDYRTFYILQATQLEYKNDTYYFTINANASNVFFSNFANTSSTTITLVSIFPSISVDISYELSINRPQFTGITKQVYIDGSLKTSTVIGQKDGFPNRYTKFIIQTNDWHYGHDVNVTYYIMFSHVDDYLIKTYIYVYIYARFDYESYFLSTFLTNVMRFMYPIVCFIIAIVMQQHLGKFGFCLGLLLGIYVMVQSGLMSMYEFVVGLMVVFSIIYLEIKKIKILSRGVENEQ